MKVRSDKMKNNSGNCYHLLGASYVAGTKRFVRILSCQTPFETGIIIMVSCNSFN